MRVTPPPPPPPPSPRNSKRRKASKMALFRHQGAGRAGATRRGLQQADLPATPASCRDKAGWRCRRQPPTRRGDCGPADFTRRTSAGDLALLTRQLATLVAADPAGKGARCRRPAVRKPSLRTLMAGVRSKVPEGHSLAEAMRGYPACFDGLFCAMVAAGETSGHLDGVLNRLG